VESTLVPLHPIYEHRLYLPSAGVFAVSVVAGFLLYTQIPEGAWRKAMAMLMVAIPLVLGSMTIARNSIWQNEVSLWKDTVSKSPQSILARINLGNAYESAEKYSEAIKTYQSALLLEAPSHRTMETNQYLSEAWYNLALILVKQGQESQAISAYENALVYDPKNADAHNNLGVLLFEHGHLDLAVEQYSQALTIEPQSAIYHFNLGEVFESQGFYDEAVRHYGEALRLDPNFSIAKQALKRLDSH